MGIINTEEGLYRVLDSFEETENGAGSVLENALSMEDWEAGREKVADIETALWCALYAAVFDRDRRRLARSLDTIGRLAAALPEKELRTHLRGTSSKIGALLPFTGAWGAPGWETVLAAAATASEDADPLRKMFLIDEGSAVECCSVPFLAFVLAPTDFPFTEEELTDIRSGWGATVKDIREQAARDREKESGTGAGRLFSGKGGEGE